MSFINILANVLNVLSSVGGILICIFFGYEEFVGEDAAEKLLAQLNIPLSIHQVTIVGFFCAILFALTAPELRNNYRYWKKLRKTFRSAKELYFDNFGDYLEMKKTANMINTKDKSRHRNKNGNGAKN